MSTVSQMLTVGIADVGNQVVGHGHVSDRLVMTSVSASMSVTSLTLYRLISTSPFYYL